MKKRHPELAEQPEDEPSRRLQKAADVKLNRFGAEGCVPRKPPSAAAGGTSAGATAAWLLGAHGPVLPPTILEASGGFFGVGLRYLFAVKTWPVLHRISGWELAQHGHWTPAPRRAPFLGASGSGEGGIKVGGSTGADAVLRYPRSTSSSESHASSSESRPSAGVVARLS